MKEWFKNFRKKYNAEVYISKDKKELIVKYL